MLHFAQSTSRFNFILLCVLLISCLLIIDQSITSGEPEILHWQEDANTQEKQEIRDYETVKKEWDEVAGKIQKYIAARRRTTSAREEKLSLKNKNWSWNGSVI